MYIKASVNSTFEAAEVEQAKGHDSEPKWKQISITKFMYL